MAPEPRLGTYQTLCIRDVEAPKPPPNPQSSLNTQCTFYPGNQQLPLETRLFCFCRPRKAREHIENVHLRYLNAHDPLGCPLCRKVLEGVTRFKNHATSRPQLLSAGVTGPEISNHVTSLLQLLLGAPAKWVIFSSLMHMKSVGLSRGKERRCFLISTAIHTRWQVHLSSLFL